MDAGGQEVQHDRRDWDAGEHQSVLQNRVSQAMSCVGKVLLWSWKLNKGLRNMWGRGG